MDQVIIFGNQSTAKEAYYCLKSNSDYQVVGFTVDKEFIESDKLCDLPVVSFDNVEKTFPPGKYKMFIAVGYVQNNRIRKERYYQSKEMGYKFINYVSPHAIVHPETIEGDNCFIGHFVVISPGVKVGNNVFIGSGSTIGHDVIIGDHCFFSNSVAIAGSVNIGSCCYLGTNSTIRNKVSIGNGCVIGAGAILLENAQDKSVYLGEPGKLLPISSDKLSLG
jgi:sugar O-acyltransferase (sialic acid O-acetyltransferase NeuD family)